MGVFETMHISKPHHVRYARTSHTLALGLFVGLLTAAAAPAQADHPAEAKPLAGKYKLAGSKADGIKVIDKAIEDGVAQMNMVKRIVVRKFLKEVGKRVIESIEIALPRNRIVVKLDDREVSSKPGKTTKLGKDDGAAKVTQRFRGGKLEQTFHTGAGTFKIVYQLVQGGAVLQRDVTLSHKWLEKPVRYRLLYKRR